jgi:hypothetical protein
MTNGGEPQVGGVSGFGVAEEEENPLSGSGGAAGPGTRAGEGDPSGEGIGVGTGDSFVDSSRNRAAREAAALGTSDDHDRTSALEYGEGDRPNPPTIGEAIGSGAGASVGSGTPPDRSGAGGGSSLGLESGPGRGSSRSASANNGG